jgi:hypothetical protein
MSSGSVFSRLVRPGQQESLSSSVNEPAFQITFNRLENSQDQQPNRRSSGAGGSIFNRLVRKPQADGAEESFGDDFGASEADDQVVTGYVKPAFPSFSYNGADDSNTRGRGSMAYRPASEQSVKTRLIRQARSRSRSPTTNRNQYDHSTSHVSKKKLMTLFMFGNDFFSISEEAVAIVRAHMIAVPKTIPTILIAANRAHGAVALINASKAATGLAIMHLLRMRHGSVLQSGNSTLIMPGTVSETIRT